MLTSIGSPSSRELSLTSSSVSCAYSMRSERTVSNKPGMAGGAEEERGRKEEGGRRGREGEGGGRGKEEWEGG